MTLLISWVGMESRRDKENQGKNKGESSIYIGSESRITWREEKKEFYDSSQKVFASKDHPIIIGICGAALFPTIAVSQFISLIDHGLLLSKESSNKEKFKIFYDFIADAYVRLPLNTNDSTGSSIVFASRERVGINSIFDIKVIELKANSTSSRVHLKEDILKNISTDDSFKLFILGADYAKDRFEKKYNEYMKISNITSRFVFQTFCNLLDEFNIENNRTCGGAPQLVGLDKNKYNNGIIFGSIYQQKRFYLGTEVKDNYLLPNSENIRWINNYFESCDPVTKELKTGAKKRKK